MRTTIWKMALVAIVVLAPASAIATTYEEALAAAGDGKYVQVNGASETPWHWSITVEFPRTLFPYDDYVWLHLTDTPASMNFEVVLYDGDTPVSAPTGTWSASGLFGPYMIPDNKEVTRVEIRQRCGGWPDGTVYLDAVTDGDYWNPGDTYAYYHAHYGVATAFPETPEPTPVDIDIKPGSYPNSLNINGNGAIPVAILGSATFDVSQVDPATLLFNGSELRVRGNNPAWHIEDVSGDFSGGPEGAPDGIADLMCQFVDDPTQWVEGQTEAAVTGNLLDGTPIEGTDSVQIVQQ